MMRLFHPWSKTFAIFIALLFVILASANAQVTLETGFSIGFNRHTFNVDNSDGILQPGIGLASTYGLPIILRKHKWELHTGIFANDLSQSYYFNTSGNHSYGQRSFSSGLETYKIPIRLGRNVQWTEKVSLSPQLGFAWLTSRRTGYLGTVEGSYITPSERIDYSAENSSLNKNKFFAEAGLDANITLYRKIDLTLGAQYSLGLQKIEQMEVSYQINRGRTYSGTVYSKGSGWKFDVGIKFPLAAW